MGMLCRLGEGFAVETIPWRSTLDTPHETVLADGPQVNRVYSPVA